MVGPGSPAQSGRMRAAVLRGGGSVMIDEVPLPQPGPGEVRLRLEGCGVCGSDLPVWEGRPWFQYPRQPGAPGHEAWGRIDAVGPGVTGWRAGERVAALSYQAYAEFDLARGDRLIRLAAELGADPFPGEALGCAVNVFRRSGIQPGDTVAVVGVGFLGALLVALAARAGARVIGIARRARARDIALAMGASEVVEFGGSAPEAVAHLTDGDLCDVVIEAGGAQATLDVAAALTRTRGRLVVAGYHQDGRREIDLQLWNWRGLDVINAHERDPEIYADGMRRAAAAVAAGQLDPTPLYTHRFALEELNVAFAALSERDPGLMKAVVCP